jgi:spore germination protein KB
MQLFWLTFLTQAYYVLSPVIGEVKQDAWIVLLLASIGILAITFLTNKLSLRYPDKTIFEYSQEILGKWLGKIIILPYLLIWFLTMMIQLSTVGDFVNLSLLPNTPIFFVFLLMMMVVTYVTIKGGITAIGRLSLVAGPLLMFISFLPLFLNFQSMKWVYLQPVLGDSNWKDMLSGTYSATGMMAEGTLLPLMLLAFTSNPKEGARKILWGYSFNLLWIILASIAILAMFGPNLAPNGGVSIFDMYIKSISILDFIQNLDVLALFIWMFHYCARIALLLFFISYGTSQWLNMKNWRKVAWILVPMALILVLLTENITMPTTIYFGFIWVTWIFPIYIIAVPLLLLIVSRIRHGAGAKM